MGYRDIIAEGVQAGAKGQLDIACNLFLKAAAEAPQDAKTLTAIAGEILKIKRYGKAHDVLLDAVKAEPSYRPANQMLGNLYLYIGKPGLAVGCFEKVLETAPEEAETWFVLGRALYESKELERALAACRKSFDLGNQTAGNYRLILLVLEVMNRLDEMKDLLDEGLEKYPGDELMQIIKAKFDARAGDYDAALRRLSGINAHDQQPNVAATIYYEMGQVLDKKGEADKAYEAFQRANNFQRKVFEAKNFDTGKSARLVEGMNAIDLGKLKTGPTADVDESRPAPVFLVGFPRSGTTLLNRILDSHADIEVMEETPVLYMIRNNLRAALGDYPALLEKLTKAHLDAGRVEYVKLLESVGKVDASKVIIDKLPLNIIHVPLITRMFPDARFIFALRHPCDACLSCFMQNFAENDEMANFLNLGDTVRFYADVMALWGKFTAALPVKFHLIRYEDLVENLEEEAKKLISFLELNWDDAVLAYREKALEKGFINTPSYSQVVQPIYRKSKFRWLRYRTFFEPYFDLLKPICDKFGYTLDE